ncbi:MAG TPA: NAD(+) synthase [Candidatus Saccharicenans sp.]|nr:NAD(+) synthase [Candidatus Saccharicenans sp.]
MNNQKRKLEGLKAKMQIKPEEVALSLEDFIRRYMEKLEREGVVLGLSGEIDSAVVAALCKRAVGPEKTLALIMPEKDSKREQTKDALALAEELGIRTRLIDITPYLKKLGVYKLFPLNKPLVPKKLKEIMVRRAYNYYRRKTGETPFAASLGGLKNRQFNDYLKRSNAYYRAKHRLRMLFLYLEGEKENRLVVGAANKSEWLVGFFVKYGCDAAADIMPLLNLYKTQVRELARYLNVPRQIIDKAPSPDIIPGLTDERALAISYEKLDLILVALEEEWEEPEIIEALGAADIKGEQIIEVKRLVEKSAHMRKLYRPET